MGVEALLRLVAGRDKRGPVREQASIAALALVLATGCQLFGGVRIHEIAIASGKPSNVAVIASVTRDGKPVADLPRSAFRVEENGQKLDPLSTHLQLLSPALVTGFQTVLLLDLNDASSESRRKQLAKAAGAFVRRVRRRQGVTVMVFDGAAKARVVSEYSPEPHATGPDQLDELLKLPARDPSRNLRGAVKQALQALDARLDGSKRPVRRGTLVTFTRGPDLAGRVASNDFEALLDDSDDQLVYVGVTGDPIDEDADTLGSAGRVMSQGKDTLAIAFDEAASLVSRLAGKYYLLSYCSPARAGKPMLRVTVAVPNTDGDDETDSFESSFDAKGFFPGCKSSSPPRFARTSKRGSATTGSGSPPSAASHQSSGVVNQPSEPIPVEPPDEHVVPPPDKPGYAP